MAWSDKTGVLRGWLAAYERKAAARSAGDSVGFSAARGFNLDPAVEPPKARIDL